MYNRLHIIYYDADGYDTPLNLAGLLIMYYDADG